MFRKLNLFGRVSSLEYMLNIRLDRILKVLDEINHPKPRTQKYGVFKDHLGNIVFVDRVDFSGDDHQHYALIIYRNRMHETVRFETLTRTDTQVTLDNFFNPDIELTGEADDVPGE